VEASKLGRSRSDKILLEGHHLLGEALESRLVPDVVFVLDRADGGLAAATGAEVVTVTEQVMGKLGTTVHPTGPIAILDRPTLKSRPDGSCIVLWGVGDPGNLGTALRSASAFGIDTVVGPGCVDIWNPKVLRASAGAHFHGTVVEIATLDLATIRAWGLEVVATTPRDGVDLGDAVMDAVALLIGSEGPGLDGDMISDADALVTIPMPGPVESLNAGVAASVLAYELARRNGGSSGGSGD